MIRDFIRRFLGSYEDGRASAFREAAELLEHCYIRDSELNPRQVLNILAEELEYRAKIEESMPGEPVE